MPNVQIFTTPERRIQRYKVKATGDTGTGVSSSNGSRNVGRLATIGRELNIQLIDICDDKTGEVRTFRAEFLDLIESVEE
ncbi:hypothetical protein [Pseudarthrobacter sp. SSS035]|uniref:hypothetical protein n=1 Tax=Pseudarthrobacter sp. SSS035 TaxID=2931399 RepID=UPI00200F5D13|nr:hypothetical protein [Pseudarthrobacter sp. SSS035]